MAVVTRYFSTTAAGAGDGTTWADRAQLHNAGTWSTVITGFNFAGSDSLKCFIGPGTHTITTNALSGGLFANPPTVANPLVLHGCDSSGVELSIPEPGWVSAEAAWDDSTLPVLATTTNIRTLNTTLYTVIARLIKFTASGCNQASILSTSLDWCTVISSTANSSAAAFSSGILTNCVVKCTGSSYSLIGAVASSLFFNSRFEGVTGSSGNRNGITIDGNGVQTVIGCTVVGCGGAGIKYISGSAAQSGVIANCTIANNGSDGISLNSTASQTNNWHVRNCCITGNGGYGIDANVARTFLAGTRLRDNTSGNLTDFVNHPIDMSVYTTDSDDATEYVDSGAGDYRIANTAATWGLGYGAGDEPAAGSGGSALHLGSLGQTGIGVF